MENEHIGLALIGCEGHGKSTLAAHMLFKTGAISEDRLSEGENRFRNILQLSSSDFDWWRYNVPFGEFSTEKYGFALAEYSNRDQLIMNICRGILYGDAVVFVVAADEGVLPQIRDILLVCKTLAIDQLIVAINKMDLVGFSEERFNELKDDASGLIESVGFNPDEVDFVPVSALEGDNLTEASERMPWYAGVTLIEAFDNLSPLQNLEKLPLRLPVLDQFRIRAVNFIVGRVQTGVIGVNDDVVFEPSGIRSNVGYIEKKKGELYAIAKPGERFGFQMRGLRRNKVKGNVLGHIDSPPTVAKEFEAKILILKHPGVITIGYTPVFHCQASSVACTFMELSKKIDPGTGEVIEENPDFLESGDAAIVRLRPTKPMCIENAKEIIQMGRFLIRDMGITVAVGLCTNVLERTE